MSIKKITRTQGTFKVYADKINELIDAQKRIKAGINIEIKESDDNILINATDGLPDGYTFEEFTICVDGAPETRWWPTWLTNPEA
jgi:hypothetical protein